MLAYILKFSLISLILIILVHYLYIYFTSLLTTPKIKDLVFVPTKKYDELYELIKQAPIDEAPAPPISTINLSSPQPSSNPIDMKTELKKYLNSQLNTMNINSSQLNYTELKST